MLPLSYVQALGCGRGHWCGSGVVLVDQVSMDAARVVVGVLLGGGFLVGCLFHHLDLIAQVIDHLQELCLQLQQG